MNRAEKIAKLSHAVRDWRGVIHPRTRKWIRPPKFRAAARVARWLEELGLNVADTMALLSAFTTYQDFHAWLRKIDVLNTGLDRQEEAR